MLIGFIIMGLGPVFAQVDVPNADRVMVFNLYSGDNIVCNNIGEHQLKSTPCESFYKDVKNSRKHGGLIKCYPALNGDTGKSGWLCSPTHSRWTTTQLTVKTLGDSDIASCSGSCSAGGHSLTIEARELPMMAPWLSFCILVFILVMCIINPELILLCCLMSPKRSDDDYDNSCGGEYYS